VTTFHQLTGSIGLANPAGPPQSDGDKATLPLPTTGFRLAGLHMFFVEVRVDGKVHTLRVVEHVG
jgi:hypothetical protein